MEPSNRAAVPRVAEQRPHREQLIKGELPMEHVPATQSQLGLQVRGSHDVGCDDERADAWCVRLESVQRVSEQHVLCHMPFASAQCKRCVMRINRCNVSALRCQFCID